MTQSAEHRRLVRLAGTINKKASQLGVLGTVTPEELYAVEYIHRECHYCGIGLEIGSGTFDHGIAFNNGGSNVYTNLIRACAKCNRSKFTKTKAQVVAYADFEVTCARPGCGTVYKPRYAEWMNGRARLCSRRCSALMRHQASSS